ncbi:MAG: replicative DNA helicase [Leptolyngbyaceae cyanobacterium]
MGVGSGGLLAQPPSVLSVCRRWSAFMVQELNFQVYSDRLPPQNIDAEEAILGGVLLDPEALSRITDLIRPEAFYITAHQEIYRAALALQNQGRPTDLMSLTTWLKDRGALEKVGGQSKLVQLIDRTVSAVNIDQYAALVMDKYMRRKLIQAGNEIAHLGHETSVELEDVLDRCEQKVFGVTQDRPQNHLASAADILTHTFSDIESRSLGMVLPGLSCGFYDLDAMTQGFQRSDLVIVAGRPSMGKCLSRDAEIVLADGSVKTIEAIYQERSAVLLTLGSDWRFNLTQPSAFIDDGIKPVFRVKTATGRAIETTLTHPYLTLKGWQPLSQLQVGQKIAVPRYLPVFGTEQMPIHQIKLLAYLMGDDCLTGASHEKTVPVNIFRLVKEQLAVFLNRLFATDGWATVLTSGQAQLGFATVSERLARQVQHLLLRFGIIARLKARSVKYGDGRRPAWQLDITDVLSIKTFIQEIGIFGKEEALDRVESVLADRPYQTHRGLIPIEVWQMVQSAKATESWTSVATRAGIQSTSNLPVGKQAPTRERLFDLATALDHQPLEEIATSDIYWDEIVEIEPLGLKQVYDLTIPETHNFVANDICVHNTSFVMNIARNIAAFHKLPVAIFSLEMSKEQLVQRLLASEVRIESSRLRAGRISQQEWEPLGHAISTLSQLPVFIDDTPNISVTEMRSKARRLQAEQGGALGLILLDYLQLMEGGSDNRVQELSKVTRSLKGLARELNVPIIALSQLSRSVESRTNKRPMMSDLRECVTGDTLVVLADGRRVPIKTLVGQTPEVISLNQAGKLVAARSDLVWKVGPRPVFRLVLASGKMIQATASHRLYGLDGWVKLQSLGGGSRIAVARSLPSQVQLVPSGSVGADGAEVLKCAALQERATSDIDWDQVQSIEPLGEADVYDLTVPGPASWLADGIVSHNSGAIEQDADLIMMLYRDEYYNPDTPDRGISEVIIAKHRNGPVGTIKLLFEAQFTQFRNLAHPNQR